MNIDKLRELSALSEKARQQMTVPGNPAEAYFRTMLAEWFRANEAELLDMQRDAGRYAFIRNMGPHLERIGRQNLMIGMFGDELDAAIDAESGKEGK